jgi:hypothetical protein
MNDRLQSTLRQLRLSGLAETLDVRLQEAAGHQLSHAEFLKLILQDELLVRNQRLIDRRVKAAQFRELKALDDFDWAFNPSIPRKQVFDLATCRFVRETREVLFLGPPGTGKSFLVQAIGYLAIKQGFVVPYRSIFDVVRDFLHDEAVGDGLCIRCSFWGRYLATLILADQIRGNIARHRQYKTASQPQNFLGDAAHHESVQPGPPMRSHDDQVAFGFPGHSQDLGSCISFGQ